MKIFNAVYGPVQSCIIAACAEREPEEWESAIDEAFQQLEAQNTVSSWSVSPYLQGLIIHFALPGYPAVDMLVLPRTGQTIDRALS